MIGRRESVDVVIDAESGDGGGHWEERDMRLLFNAEEWGRWNMIKGKAIFFIYFIN